MDATCLRGELCANLTSRLGQGGALGRRLGKAFAYADSPPDERLIGYFLWADPARVLGLFAPEHRATLAM